MGALNVRRPLPPLGTYLYETTVFPALGMSAKKMPIQSSVEWELGAVHCTVTVPSGAWTNGETVRAYPGRDVVCALLSAGSNGT